MKRSHTEGKVREETKTPTKGAVGGVRGAVAAIKKLDQWRS